MQPHSKKDPSILSARQLSIMLKFKIIAMSENVDSFRNFEGRGVTAFIDGKSVAVGNLALMEEHSVRITDADS